MRGAMAAGKSFGPKARESPASDVEVKG
jgi:hypothetical protein